VDPTSRGAETTRTVAGCRADDANPEELGALIAYDVPEGFRLQPHSAGDTGPSDLAKAIRDDQAEGAERALRDARFRRGYQWLWTNDRDDEIIVFLYEFCEPEGARAYVNRAVGELRRSQLEPIGSLTLPGVEGFRGQQEGFGFVGLVSATGPYDVNVVANGETSSVTLEELTRRAESVLRSQLERL
jgi:hypothetical protein